MSEAFGDDVKATVYWAPDGRNCLSRRDALNYMVHRLNSPTSEVVMMRQGLLVDGWVELESLPPGWLAMKKPEGGLKFCTSDYVFCRNPKAALKYMMEKESQEEIAKFTKEKDVKVANISSDLTQIKATEELLDTRAELFTAVKVYVAT